jgi:hypothetical protein
MGGRADVDAAMVAWRDAERRLRIAKPGSQDQVAAIAEMRVARKAYETMIVAGSHRRARTTRV